MLRKEAVSSDLLEVLNQLMKIPLLSNHRLVGGTALALQIGHRISIDIDLFSNSISDYQQIEKALLNSFSKEIKISHRIHSPLGKGLCFFIRGIKTDILDWNIPFGYPAVELNNIRLAAQEEIVRMKLDILTSPPEIARYEKKDFIDLAFLMGRFNISEMIAIYKTFHPEIEFVERHVLEALQYSELADKKPNPQMLLPLSWDEVKAKINQEVSYYISTRLNS